MKKLIKVMGILCLSAVLYACGSSAQTPSATMEMKSGESVHSVVTRINDEIGIAMPADVDDTALKEVFYVNPADVEAYAGKFAMVMTSSDNVVAVKAKEGKAEDVASALERRLEDVKNSFEQYLPEQFAKAEKGAVIRKGDYVFLLIVGQLDDTIDQDYDKAKKIIDEAFG